MVGSIPAALMVRWCSLSGTERHFVLTHCRQNKTPLGSLTAETLDGILARRRQGGGSGGARRRTARRRTASAGAAGSLTAAAPAGAEEEETVEYYDGIAVEECCDDDDDDSATKRPRTTNVARPASMAAAAVVVATGADPAREGTLVMPHGWGTMRKRLPFPEEDVRHYTNTKSVCASCANTCAAKNFWVLPPTLWKVHPAPPRQATLCTECYTALCSHFMGMCNHPTGANYGASTLLNRLRAVAKKVPGAVPAEAVGDQAWEYYIQVLERGGLLDPRKAAPIGTCPGCGHNDVALVGRLVDPYPRRALLLRPSQLMCAYCLDQLHTHFGMNGHVCEHTFGHNESHAPCIDLLRRVCGAADSSFAADAQLYMGLTTFGELRRFLGYFQTRDNWLNVHPALKNPHFMPRFRASPSPSPTARAKRKRRSPSHFTPAPAGAARLPGAGNKLPSGIPVCVPGVVCPPYTAPATGSPTAFAPAPFGPPATFVPPPAFVPPAAAPVAAGAGGAPTALVVAAAAGAPHASHDVLESMNAIVRGTPQCPPEGAVPWPRMPPMQTLVAEMVNSDNSMRQQVAAIPQALGHPVVTLFLHEYTAMNTSQWQIMNLMMEARRRLFNRHRLSFQRLRVVNREEHVAARVLAAWQRGVPQQHQQQHQQ